MTDLSPDVEALLDKSYESDLTEEESEELLLLCGHGIGPKLSPAAQAVLDSAINVAESPDAEAIAAAALRAAADQVVPEKLESYGIRYELLRIATELEENNG
jgi:20S proteasome alpha/beta subunit